jgi:hypothetical protein
MRACEGVDLLSSSVNSAESVMSSQWKMMDVMRMALRLQNRLVHRTACMHKPIDSTSSLLYKILEHYPKLSF